MIEIKNRFSGAVLFKSETATTVREALIGGIGAHANLTDADLADAYLAGADLAGADLARADLTGANLRGAYLAGADLARADLTGANLRGADLTGANLRGAYLADANLAGADLADANLARADLADANLARADLADANLAGAYLTGAYLTGARNVPDGTEKTDPPIPYDRSRAPDYAARALAFRERNPEVPVVEDLDRKIFESVTSGGGQLQMGSWHTCETTHCRGGWAIHHAGKAGYELEAKLGVEFAARAIYRASTGRTPHFYATNERAMADIKRRSQAEGT